MPKIYRVHILSPCRTYNKLNLVRFISIVRAARSTNVSVYLRRTNKFRKDAVSEWQTFFLENG
jgi:hypothetical protein